MWRTVGGSNASNNRKALAARCAVCVQNGDATDTIEDLEFAINSSIDGVGRFSSVQWTIRSNCSSLPRQIANIPYGSLSGSLGDLRNCHRFGKLFQNKIKVSGCLRIE